MQHCCPYLSVGQELQHRSMCSEQWFCARHGLMLACVRIASVFEFTVFVAWWGRSLDLKLLGVHSMQDTACSEAWAQTAEEEQCALPAPVFHRDLGFLYRSHCLSSCFCFLLCVCLCLCLTFSSVLSGVLSPQPFFLLLKYLLLSQSWISACTVSLKVSPWIMCMHWAWLWCLYHLPAQCADVNTLKLLLLLLLAHDSLTIYKMLKVIKYLSV